MILSERRCYGEEIRQHCRAAGRGWLLAWRVLVDAAVRGIEGIEEREPAPDDLTAIRGVGPAIVTLPISLLHLEA